MYPGLQKNTQKDIIYDHYKKKTNQNPKYCISLVNILMIHKINKKTVQLEKQTVILIC